MLKKIRQKPYHIKQSISLGLTIVIFCAILFIWVSSWDARARGQEVRAKIVSPTTGITSAFDGFVLWFNERATVKKSSDSTTNTTTKDTFDFSGVVIIDHSASSSEAVSLSAKKEN